MSNQDPTEPLRVRAGRYSGVDEGTACTQSSFKVNGKGFLYIGEQGGRYKAMFKLSASREEALRLAASRPEDFQVGTGDWVTARFSTDDPLPRKLWERWLDESYAACSAGSSKSAKPPAGERTVARKKAAKTEAAKRKTATKKAARKKTAKKARARRS